MRPTKKAKESYTEMSQMVLPNDTNLLGNLLGGQLMHWVDIVGAMVATRHANRKVATVSMDAMEFHHPIRRGEFVFLEATLIWVGNSSMQIEVKVFAENSLTGARIQSNYATLTFVALDDEERPVLVPGLEIETEEQQQLFDRAQKAYEKKKKERQSVNFY